MAFTVLAFFMMFHVDLHRVIQRKSQAQNAGDAAALAAVRWQGATLNLIGELNLLHVLALAAEDFTAVDAITNMQARLNFTGPYAALYAAQVAAKNNRMYVDPDLTKLYQGHEHTMRTLYATYYPEPWLNGWTECADILNAICADGLAAGPDNARFLSDPQGGHILFDKAFYEAVAGMSWCWFFLFHNGVEQAYQSSQHPIPDIDDTQSQDYENNEIFGLGLRSETNTMWRISRLDMSGIEQHIENAGLSGEITGSLYATGVTHSVETWYFYNPDSWTTWEDIKPDGEFQFPAAGEVRPHYDYAGADAVVRVSATVDRMMPEGRRGATGSATVNWTAAAKPFGYLETPDGKTRPDSAGFGLVLPAFRDVRLIPADTASNSDAFSSDIDWVHHVKIHLPRGIRDPSCAYCNALTTWEIPSFRQMGIDWLAENSHRCRIPTGGGPRRGGGSKRGH